MTEPISAKGMIGMCFLPTFVDAKLDWTRRSQNSHHETQFYLQHVG